MTDKRMYPQGTGQLASRYVNDVLVEPGLPKTLRTRVTTAQINAGFTLLPALPGYPGQHLGAHGLGGRIDPPQAVPFAFRYVQAAPGHGQPGWLVQGLLLPARRVRQAGDADAAQGVVAFSQPAVAPPGRGLYI